MRLAVEDVGRALHLDLHGRLPDDERAGGGAGRVVRVIERRRHQVVADVGRRGDGSAVLAVADADDAEVGGSRRHGHGLGRAAVGLREAGRVDVDGRRALRHFEGAQHVGRGVVIRVAGLRGADGDGAGPVERQGVAVERRAAGDDFETDGQAGARRGLEREGRVAERVVGDGREVDDLSRLVDDERPRDGGRFVVRVVERGDDAVGAGGGRGLRRAGVGDGDAREVGGFGRHGDGFRRPVEGLREAAQVEHRLRLRHRQRRADDVEHVVVRRERAE